MGEKPLYKATNGVATEARVAVADEPLLHIESTCLLDGGGLYSRQMDAVLGAALEALPSMILRKKTRENAFI